MTLCQFLPGPTSSQTGFSIGLMRAAISAGLRAPPPLVVIVSALGGVALALGSG
jgi:chromate transporter